MKYIILLLLFPAALSAQIRSYDTTVVVDLADKFGMQRKAVFSSLAYNYDQKVVGVIMTVKYFFNGQEVNEPGITPYKATTNTEPGECIIVATQEPMADTTYNNLYAEHDSTGAIERDSLGNIIYKPDAPLAYDSFSFYVFVAQNYPIKLHEVIRGAMIRWARRNEEL